MAEHNLTARQARKLEKDAFRKMQRSVSKGDGQLNYSIYTVFRDWLRGEPDPTYDEDFLQETARRFADYHG